MQMKGDQIPLQWAAQAPCEARFAPLISGFRQYQQHHHPHHHTLPPPPHHRHHFLHLYYLDIYNHCSQVWARHADIAFVEKESGFVDLEIR